MRNVNKRTLCICVICLLFNALSASAYRRYSIIKSANYEILFSVVNTKSICLLRVDTSLNIVIDSVVVFQKKGGFDYKFPEVAITYYKTGIIHHIYSNSNYNYQGNYYSFDSLGRMFEIIPYLDGIKNGIYYKYTPSGILVERTEYIKGEKDGKECIYDYKGRLLFETSYSQGVRNGLRKIYLYTNGNISKSENYANNKKQGITTEYYRSGKVYSIRNYKDDTPDGETTYYNRFGKIQKQYVYSNGNLIQTRYYRFGKQRRIVNTTN